MTRSEALQNMVELLDRTGGVLTAAEIHPDIPTIHDVGCRGQSLTSAREVVHKGFGLFMGNAPDGEPFSFDAGGAMSRSEEPYPDGVSYTALRCSYAAAESMGYDRGSVRLALKGMMEEQTD